MNGVDTSQVNRPGSNDQEDAVGITAFVSPGIPGFQCIIKQRYTDFLVNEILPDGHVLHLTNTSVKRKREEQKSNPPANGVKNNDTDLSGTEGVELETDGAPDKSQYVLEPELGLDDGSIPRKKRRTDDEDTNNTDGSVEAIDMVDPRSIETPSGASKKDQKEEIISSISEADRTTLQDIFGETTAKQILSLYANIMLHPDRKPRDHAAVKSELIPEKSKRTEAHVAIRRIFASKLETLTLQDLPGVMSIKAAPTKGPSGARGRPNGEAPGAIQKGKLGWEQLGGEYLHFTLYKENKDTMEVLFFLASKLKVPQKNFQFAGTKDRRGVTVQRVALFRVHAELVASLNRFARGWRLGDFEYQKHGLELGELHGNEFLLTLRECLFPGQEVVTHEQKLEMTERLVADAANSFKNRGFLNYYGLQRFGTFSTGTHVTGRKILKGDLEGAVDSILAYSDDMLPEKQDLSSLKKVPQDDIDRANAIRMWRKTGQSNEATTIMPRRFQAEAAIIQHLSKKDRKSGELLQSRDWQGALMQIQRNLRLMYVHAYQSFVWNTVASKRWDIYGDRVIEGDLVIVGEKDDGTVATKAEVDEDGEPIFHPAADDSGPTAEDSFTRARHLSKEEAESGKYDIFDIVLPLPGYDVEYSSNELGRFYEEFMASEVGGGLDPHKMRRGMKDFSLSGSYRKMMARPGEDFGFEVKSYVKDEEQMVETDLERLEKPIDGKSGADADQNGDLMSQDAERKIAVVLKMQLGSSQYATMALRELTKGGAFSYKPEYSAR